MRGAAGEVLSATDEASRLAEELSSADELVHKTRNADPADVEQLLAVLDASLQRLQRRAEALARALELLTDDELQARLERFNQQVTRGEPFDTLPADDVAEHLRQRQADLGV